MRSRRAIFLLMVLVGLLLVGGGVLLMWLGGERGSSFRDAPVVGNAAMPERESAPPRSVEEEIACVDRLIAAGANAGGGESESGNMQAAFERCRFVPPPVDINAVEASGPAGPAVNRQAGAPAPR